MAQSDFGTINPTTKSGSALATDLNNWRDAVHSGHRGSNRPSYVQGGMSWVQEVSSTTWRWYLYDGAQDILIGTINPTLDTFTPAIPAGSIAASAVVQGPSSGLNADQVDGLHATAFLRADASSNVAFGYSVRFVHPAAANTDDGKIVARSLAKGLNIVGSATEAGDAQRYVTIFGNTEIIGTLNISGQVTFSGEIAGTARIKAYDGAAQALVGSKGTYPVFATFNTLGNSGAGYGWAMFGQTNNQLGFAPGVNENAGGGVGVRQAFAPSGDIWTQTYGWLHERFARREAIAGMAAWRDTGARPACGVYNCNKPFNSGVEVFDTGDGRHQLRYYGGIQTSWNCETQPPQCSACTCFPSETLVLLTDGRRIKISEVRVGDILLGGFGHQNVVLGIDRSKLGNRPLKVLNGYHRFTEEHRHVSPQGWVSMNAEATMAEHNQWYDVIIDNNGTIAPRLMVKFTRTPILALRTGITLLKAGGENNEVVRTIEDDWSRPADEVVYSLVMSGSHTFLANGFIVSGWARDDDFDYTPWFGAAP